MIYFFRRSIVICFLLTFSGAVPAGAEISQIEVNSWIDPRENIVAGQRIDLNIEIATTQQLQKGVRIGLLELENAIVLQRQKFATNSTRQKDGRTWMVQQWTVQIFPLVSGPGHIPSLPIRVSLSKISPEEEKPEVHLIMTDPINFIVSRPEALNGVESWVASDTFDVTDRFDLPLDTLRVGDALTRTIRLKANSIPAMMLPETQTSDLEGLTVHRDLPRLTDQSNRGQLVGERIETLIYVPEKSGVRILPEHRFAWWDTQSEQLRWTILPERHLTVVGTGVGHSSSFFWKTGLALGLSIILAGISVTLLQRRASQWRLRLKIRWALFTKDQPRALDLLYQWLSQVAPDQGYHSIRHFLEEIKRPDLTREFNNAMTDPYGPDSAGSGNLKNVVAELFRSARTYRHQERVGCELKFLT